MKRITSSFQHGRIHDDFRNDRDCRRLSFTNYRGKRNFLHSFFAIRVEGTGRTPSRIFAGRDRLIMDVGPTPQNSVVDNFV